MSIPAIGGNRILLDSNLYVLLCVGMTDLSYIRRHKRLGGYDQQDFELLSEMVNQADGLVIAPNVATETSNLTRQIADPAREQIALTLRRLVG